MLSRGVILVEVNSTVGELAERSLSLDLGGLLGVLYWRDMSVNCARQI
jgi:hypothetical protein